MKVVKAPLAQTEFLPVWYGFAMLSTEEGCQEIVPLLADCSLFDIGSFYFKVHLSSIFLFLNNRHGVER